MAGRPKYNPEEVAAMVLEGRLTSNMTVTNYLVNHNYDVRDLTTELLTTLPSRFVHRVASAEERQHRRRVSRLL